MIEPFVWNSQGYWILIGSNPSWPLLRVGSQRLVLGELLSAQVKGSLPWSSSKSRLASSIVRYFSRMSSVSGGCGWTKAVSGALYGGLSSVFRAFCYQSNIRWLARNLTAALKVGLIALTSRFCTECAFVKAFIYRKIACEVSSPLLFSLLAGNSCNLFLWTSRSLVWCLAAVGTNGQIIRNLEYSWNILLFYLRADCVKSVSFSVFEVGLYRLPFGQSQPRDS